MSTAESPHHPNLPETETSVENENENLDDEIIPVTINHNNLMNYYVHLSKNDKKLFFEFHPVQETNKINNEIFLSKNGVNRHVHKDEYKCKFHKDDQK